MASGFEPLPLFDCFYCCKEHFVLRKCSECILSVKYNHTVGMLEFAAKRYARPKILDDYEQVSDVLGELAKKQELRPAPALLWTDSRPLCVSPLLLDIKNKIKADLNPPIA